MSSLNTACRKHLRSELAHSVNQVGLGFIQLQALSFGPILFRPIELGSGLSITKSNPRPDINKAQMLDPHLISKTLQEEEEEEF